MASELMSSIENRTIAKIEVAFPIRIESVAYPESTSEISA
jgi:hypothetical protein